MADETQTESRIVVGHIGPMLAANMRIGGRSAARGAGCAKVDLAYAKDLAERRCGDAAAAAIGRQLLNLAAQGGDVVALAKATNELLDLAEGVKTCKPSPLAVQVANRLLTPESVMSMAGQEGAMDLVVLAYAALHYDEVCALNGGLHV